MQRGRAPVRGVPRAHHALLRRRPDVPPPPALAPGRSKAEGVEEWAFSQKRASHPSGLAGGVTCSASRLLYRVRFCRSKNSRVQRFKGFPFVRGIRIGSGRTFEFADSCSVNWAYIVGTEGEVERLGLPRFSEADLLRTRTMERASCPSLGSPLLHPIRIPGICCTSFPGPRHLCFFQAVAVAVEKRPLALGISGSESRKTVLLVMRIGGCTLCTRRIQPHDTAM